MDNEPKETHVSLHDIDGTVLRIIPFRDIKEGDLFNHLLEEHQHDSTRYAHVASADAMLDHWNEWGVRVLHEPYHFIIPKGQKDWKSIALTTFVIGVSLYATYRVFTG